MANSRQAYFKKTYGRPVKFAEAFGVRIGKDAIFPAEFMDVLPGQVYRKRLDEDQQRKFIQGSTAPPDARLKSIRDAVAPVSCSCLSFPIEHS